MTTTQVNKQPDGVDDVEQLREAHAQGVEQLRASRELSDQAKRVKMAALTMAAKAAMEDLQQRDGGLRAATRTDTMRRAFSYGREPNVHATDETRQAAQALHRDAVARVAGVDDSRELSNLLQQADDLDDESLARAVGYRAFQTGAHDVLETYAAGRKSQGIAVNELLDLPPEPTALEAVFRYAMHTPKELDGLGDHGIAQLAQTDLGSPSDQ